MKFNLERYPSNIEPNPILTPRKNIEWEAGAVFNPCVVYDNGIFKMLYRTYPSSLKETGPRITRPGFHLANQISYIGYAESTDGNSFVRRDVPFISPSESYDKYGCEDPRITKFGDVFYITYTAIDAPLDDKTIKPNVRIALATTKDFVTIIKHGIIGPAIESKAAALFPEMINGKIALILTISSDSTNSHIAVRYFDSLEQLLHPSDKEWEDFLSHSKDTAVLKTYPWLHRGPELGAPPLKTKEGWLLIFSAESMSDTWVISAALLDLEDPRKLLTRAKGNILQPVTTYEREGLVPNVTFPSGAVIVDDKLFVYYGCADTVIGLSTCNMPGLLKYLGS
jgi:predicted GH43/DUF377 family glycosyl hydrolase